jgi:hypothetical protein
MPEDPQLDTNDTALAQYFLRGMRCFEKYILTQNIAKADSDATWNLIGQQVQHTVEARIETAYRLARSQFTPMKETK